MIVNVTRIPATERPEWTVILLHGLGNSGLSWRKIPDLIGDPHINYIFPDSNIQPVTAMPYAYKSMWFDILDPGFGERLAEHDESMFWEGVQCVEELIDLEVKRGIPSNRIIVGGFSQGGSIALGVAISYKKPLAGIICFRGFITTRKEVDKRLKNANFDVDIIHLHGENDPMIHRGYAMSTTTFMKILGFHNYKLVEFESSIHGIEEVEMEYATNFIKSQIYNSNSSS